ncbi:MAG: MerR family transcriptional regulator [Anaerolineae bacterium]|nr:MerR family transcriptional regulator [Anaerolineae bacterium]
MKPESFKKETYYVHEFARMAGVTVRTLHYYDQTGLLKPAAHTQKRHRLYKRGDMMRLQQILTLKYMGFSLEDIRELLESPAYELEKSLRIQKQAIEQRIAELQQAAQALELTMQAVAKADEPDWKMIAAIIQAVQEGRRWQWVNSYYTPEQAEQIAEYGKQFTAEDMLESQRQWADLTERFKTVRHLPFDHPDVEALAAEMNALVLAFTRGDKGIENSLRTAYSSIDKHIPPHTLDMDTMRFMGAALDHYRQKEANDGI